MAQTGFFFLFLTQFHFGGDCRVTEDEEWNKKSPQTQISE